jgi:hypothetical protein
MALCSLRRVESELESKSPLIFADPPRPRMSTPASPWPSTCAWDWLLELPESREEVSNKESLICCMKNDSSEVCVLR